MSYTIADIERMTGGKVEVHNGVARVVRPLATAPRVAPKVPLRTSAEVRYKSKWEARYAGWLSVECAHAHPGEVRWFAYECLRLRLAQVFTSTGKSRSTWYTPDFLVIRHSRVEIDEVKGHWREAARIKMKLVAQQFPWLPIRIVAFDGANPIILEMYNQ